VLISPDRNDRTTLESLRAAFWFPGLKRTSRTPCNYGAEQEPNTLHMMFIVLWDENIPDDLRLYASELLPVKNLDRHKDAQDRLRG
jgi:hypothetical protein